MSSFSYMPIDSSKHEIRLITIQPASHDPTIRCTIKHVSLDDRPAYTALSYAWGDRNDQTSIVLNNEQVCITVSLASALSHLRGESAVTLWADGLCINQSDDREKSELVQQMKRIYQEANHVLVWLGPADEDGDSARAIDFMNRFGKGASDLGFWDFPRQTWLEEWFNPSGHWAKLHKFIEEEITFSHPFAAITRLTQRRWWSRIWVLQDLCLPKTSLSNVASRKYHFYTFLPPSFPRVPVYSSWMTKSRSSTRRIQSQQQS
jgi:hypothetical protein